MYTITTITRPREFSRKQRIPSLKAAKLLVTPLVLLVSMGGDCVTEEARRHRRPADVYFMREDSRDTGHNML
ncbi:hypothetical protein EVAR_23233_1 [Eumeta japonica]|uniref:Uncharacterized protein n=1 Tax=Eumeta variegata TaxID=151549 RepID=A0A4C1VDK2_EUMVA|nr:hypothetical protein EVAR_23233_1 [Eumeta japonica]